MDRSSRTRLRHLLALLAACAVSTAPAKAAEKELPTLSQVRAMVVRHFEKLPDHEAADLISRGQVEPVFAQLQKAGWRIADRQAILAGVLDDGSYVVRKLRSPAGKKFMRKVSGYPLAYDRLDQISRLPGGELMIDDFLRFPNSELTFSDKGRLDIQRYVRLVPKDKRNHTDLDKPSGRIYTVDMLLKRLEQSYQKELRKLKATKKRSRNIGEPRP